MEEIKKPKIGGAKRLSEFARDIRKSEPSKKLKEALCLCNRIFNTQIKNLI